MNRENFYLGKIFWNVRAWLLTKDWVSKKHLKGQRGKGCKPFIFFFIIAPIGTLAMLVFILIIDLLLPRLTPVLKTKKCLWYCILKFSSYLTLDALKVTIFCIISITKHKNGIKEYKKGLKLHFSVSTYIQLTGKKHLLRKFRYMWKAWIPKFL